MKHFKILMLVMLVFFLPLVQARLFVTEVMHTPTQTSSQDDNEWFELFNDGLDQENLSEWTIEGKRFDVVLPPKSYLVIARELVDGADADNESFECVYGNCNGIWDEDFDALDSSFSLTDPDTITLTHLNETFTLSYDHWGGYDGKTLELKDYSCPYNKSCWGDGLLGGTPGKGQGNRNLIVFSAELVGLEPVIEYVAIPDEDPIAEGIQVIPQDRGKSVTLKVGIKNDAYDNVTSSLVFKGKTYNLSRSFSNATIIEFNGTINFLQTDRAGDYNLTLKIKNNDFVTTKTLTLSYLRSISTFVYPNNLDFGKVQVGNVSEPQAVNITNSGNVDIAVGINGTLINDNVSFGFVEISKDKSGWSSDSTEVILQPGETKEFYLRLNPQQGIREKYLLGVINIVAREQE